MVTLVLAQWLPKLRAAGKPTPPLFWMPWVPLGRGRGLGDGWPWFSRRLLAEARLALSAGLHLAGPGRLGRPCDRADGGAALAGRRVHPADRRGPPREAPHDIYPFSIEPFRLVEMVWPNILGTQFDGNNYWGEMIHDSGSTAQGVGAVALPGGIDLCVGA